MSFARIRPRRGTATQWTTANPILTEGEMGVEVPDSGVGTGAVKIKFGDGVTAWKDLPYGTLKVSDHIVYNLENTGTYKVPNVVTVKNAIDELSERIDKLNLYTGGIELVSGQDADEILTPGRYYARTDSIAIDIFGIPVNKAFTMIVDHGNGINFPRQTIYTMLGDEIWTRTYNSSAGKWYNDGNWRHMSLPLT